MNSEYDIFGLLEAGMIATNCATEFALPSPSSPSVNSHRTRSDSDGGYWLPHMFSTGSVQSPNTCALGTSAQRRLSSRPVLVTTKPAPLAGLMSKEPRCSIPLSTTATSSQSPPTRLPTDAIRQQLLDDYGLSIFEYTSSKPSRSAPVNIVTVVTGATAEREPSILSPPKGCGETQKSPFYWVDYTQSTPHAEPCRPRRRSTVVRSPADSRSENREFPPTVPTRHRSSRQRASIDFLTHATAPQRTSPDNSYDSALPQNLTAESPAFAAPSRRRESDASVTGVQTRSSISRRSRRTSAESRSSGHATFPRFDESKSVDRPFAMMNSHDNEDWEAPSPSYRRGRAQSRRKATMRDRSRRTSLLPPSDSQCSSDLDVDGGDSPEDTLRRTGAGLPQQWKALAHLVELSRKRRQSRDSVASFATSRRFDDPDVPEPVRRRSTIDWVGSLGHLSLLSSLDCEDGVLAQISPGFFDQSLFLGSADGSDAGDDEENHDLSFLSDCSAPDTSSDEEDDNGENHPRHSPMFRCRARNPVPARPRQEAIDAAPRAPLRPVMQGFAVPHWQQPQSGFGVPPYPPCGCVHNNQQAFHARQPQPYQAPYNNVGGTSEAYLRGPTLFRPSCGAPQPQPLLNGPKLDPRTKERVDFGTKYGWRLEDARWVDSPR